MSLWSRSPVRVIGLCPDRLTLAVDRRARNSVSDQEFVSVTTTDSAHWQAAVDALPAALALSVEPKPRVSLVLSNHFVRYALLPWNSALRSKDEWLALARHRFAGMQANAATDWAIRVSEASAQGPHIACAMEQTLLDAIQAKVAGYGARLGSVQPYLMAAFNGIRFSVGNQSFWLVIEEPGRLSLALIQDGTWRLIRSHRVDTHWRSALPEILERENAILAVENPCTRAVVCTHEALSANLHGGFRYLHPIDVARISSVAAEAEAA